MTGRLIRGAGIAAALLVPTSLWAQGGPTGYPSAAPPGQMSPAGWMTPGPAPGGYPPMGPYGAPPTAQGYCPQPGMPYGPGCPPGGGAVPPTYTEALPDDCGWGYASPLDRHLANAFRKTYVRLEYLNWSVDRPGDDLIGAPVNEIDPRTGGLIDPRRPLILPVTGQRRFPPLADFQDRFFGDEFVGDAFVPDLGEVELENLDGIRATIGVPLVFGAFEANIWTLAQEVDKMHADIIPDDGDPNTPFAGILATVPTFIGGFPANSGILFNESFEAKYAFDMWGTETNLLFDAYTQGTGLNLRPLVGFRYISIQSSLDVEGRSRLVSAETGAGFEDPISEGPIEDPATGLPLRFRDSHIESSVSNNIYGPQIGLRSELVHDWFTIGVEPKIGLAVNTYEAAVETRNLFDPRAVTTIVDDFGEELTVGEAPVNTRSQHTEFSPVFQLGVSGKIHITPYLSVWVGYDLLWIGQISRPEDNVFYNAGGAGGRTPQVVVRPHLTDLLTQGISVGGELRFGK